MRAVISRPHFFCCHIFSCSPHPLLLLTGVSLRFFVRFSAICLLILFFKHWHWVKMLASRKGLGRMAVANDEGDKLSNVMASIGHICCDLNQGALSSCLPFLMMYNGYSYTAVSFLIFFANICSAVIQPVFGAIGDKHPCPWFMALGVFLAGAGICLIGFAPNYFLVCVAAMIAGIGNAMFHPEGGRISNLAAGNRKSNGMSIFAVGGNIGFFVGPFLAAIFLSNFGMHGTLIFLVPCTLCSVALLAFNKRFRSLGKATDVLTEAKKHEPEHWKNFWINMLALAGVQFCNMACLRSFLFSSLVSWVRQNRLVRLLFVFIALQEPLQLL